MKEYEEYEEINPFKKRKHSNRHTKAPKLKRINSLRVGAIVASTLAAATVVAINSPSPINWIKKETHSISEIKEQYNKHEFGSWVIVKAEDCENDGLRERKCSVCGETISETVAKHHHIVKVMGTEADCLHTGLSDGEICDVCGKVIKEQEVLPVSDHIYDDGVITLEATCIKDGVMTFTCSVCNSSYTETINKTDKHISETIAGKPATCLEDGSSNYQRCKVCHKLLSEQTIIPAKGHNVVTLAAVNPTCTKEGHGQGKWCDVCGKIFDYGEIYAIVDHQINWDVPTYIEPTCTSNGAYIFKCMFCSYSETEVLDPYGHDDFDGDGFCNRCGATIH